MYIRNLGKSGAFLISWPKKWNVYSPSAQKPSKLTGQYDKNSISYKLERIIVGAQLVSGLKHITYTMPLNNTHFETGRNVEQCLGMVGYGQNIRQNWVKRKSRLKPSMFKSIHVPVRSSKPYHTAVSKTLIIINRQNKLPAGCIFPGVNDLTKSSGVMNTSLSSPMCTTLSDAKYLNTLSGVLYCLIRFSYSIIWNEGV